MTVLTPSNAFPHLAFPQHLTGQTQVTSFTYPGSVWPLATGPAVLSYGAAFPGRQAVEARSFNGSSDSAVAAVNLSSVAQLTICFWLWQNAFDASDELAMEYSVNLNANPGAFYIDPNSSQTVGGANKVEINYKSATGGGLSQRSFIRPSAAAWHHWAIQIDVTLSSHQVTKAYIDGINQSLADINDLAAATAAFGNFNLYLMSRAGTSLFNAGRMADIAMFNIILNSTQVSSLASGNRANAIGANANLVWYLPITGASPEPDQSGGGNNATLTGTTAITNGPPLGDKLAFPQHLTGQTNTVQNFLYPGAVQPAVPVTFLAAWALNRNFLNEGVAS